MLLGVLFPTPVRADELYASIRGTVTDQSGAVLAAVNVTAVNIATGVSRSAVTNSTGAYAFLQLPVGDYALRIEKPGFKVYSASHVHLEVNQVFDLDVHMEIGAVAEQVVVEANAVQVETTTPQRGDVVDSNQIENMPLIGRNWVNLQQLESGVVAASDARLEFATNGSQTTQNSFLINGTDTNDLPLNTRSVVPSPDAIEEFRMVTNTMNPEYGRNSGAVVNALIKSGSNAFHGDAFEFYRDSFLNSSDYFTHQRAIFHQNLFGGTIGGPIWKNHSFFFFSYQGYRVNQPQPSTAPSVTTYDPGQLNGTVAFPGLSTSSTIAPIDLVGDDGNAYAANTTPYSTIFSSGIIPTADINPIVQSLEKYIPAPNQPNNVFSFQPVQTLNQDQYIIRIDQNIGKNDLLWGTWFQESRPSTETLPFVGATVPGFSQVDQRHWKFVTLAWSHTLNDHMINELRAGYTRFNYNDVLPETPTLPSSLGFSITPQDPSLAGLPVMNIAGLFNLGFSQFGPQPRKDITFELVDNFSFNHGQHAFKVGFDMRRFQVDNPFYAENSGFFNYAGTGAYTTGNPGADFLLGIPDFYIQESGGFGNNRGQEYYSYFQDQWKVRPNLTLSYGLGWTIDVPLVDSSYNGHGMAAFYPGQQSVVYPNAPLGVVYSGDPGVHASGTTHPFRNFGPRLGFAYSPDLGRLSGGAGRMSIRGGFGMYYNRVEEELNLQFQGVPPNSVATFGALSNGGSPTFANPFVDIAGQVPTANNPFPFLGAPSNVQFTSANGNLPVWAGCCSSLDQNNVDPTAYNYSLTVERLFPGSTIFSLGYVGAVAHHLMIGHPRNLVTSVAPCVAQYPACNLSNQQFTQPGDFIYPGNVYGTIDTISSIGNSNYNSLQAGLKKRLSRGLEFSANYTWSHSLDNGSGFENSAFGGLGFGGLSNVRAYNPYCGKVCNYGSSIFDARQRLVIGYFYELPHPSLGSGLLSRATKGWTIAGITTFQKGFPMDVVDTSGPSLHCYSSSDFACFDAPNQIAPITYSNPHSAGNPYFSASSFLGGCPIYGSSAPAGCVPLGSFGDAPRNPLVGPGINNWDFQLFKDTNITEKTRLELRIEFYNLFNHTQFAPGGIVTDVNQGANFGREFAANPPREIQLAGKFYF
jgi:hypothetical protein